MHAAQLATEPDATFFRRLFGVSRAMLLAHLVAEASAGANTGAPQSDAAELAAPVSVRCSIAGNG